MHTSNFSLGFQDHTGTYELSLHATKGSSKKTIQIDNTYYKLVGSTLAVSQLRSYINTSTFTSTTEFTATLEKNIGSQKKGEIIFQNILGKPPLKTMEGSEKQFWKWLSAFNSGDRNQIEQFYHSFKEPQDISSINDAFQFSDYVQGFDYIKTVITSPNHIEILLQERGAFQEHAILSMTVEDKKPHRILNMNISPTFIEPEPIKRLPENEAIQAIETKIKLLAKAEKFSGTVLITKQGSNTPLLSCAVGKANLKDKTDINMQTKFNIASMGKMFTTVAILQLVESGKLNLTDPIGTYLKTNICPKLQEVTVEQLLTHTGGTGHTRGEEFQDAQSPKDFMKLCKDRKPKFTPGTQWEYSNYGFVLLGALIEEITLKSYYDVIQGKVFDEVGMKESDFHFKEDHVPNVSIGYIRKRDGLHDNSHFLPLRGTPAGGGYSTAEDLNHFAQAILENKLLKPESIHKICTPKRVTPENCEIANYAIGFQGGDLWFGHEGRDDGCNGVLKIYPKTGYIITVLANQSPPSATNLADFIGDVLPDKN